MKAITLALFMAFGVFLFSSCSETKDTSDSKVTDEKPNTEQQYNTSNDESVTKEKANEEIKNEKDADIKLKVKDSKLESASFTAASMHCTGCEQTITGTVGKLDGVQSVTADYHSKQVQVIFVSDKITSEDIARAITDSGFECKVNN
jgi:copper chaperone